MAKRPLIIHIGYHKTGTTWLQRVLFQPRFGYRQLMSHEEVFETIVRPHSLIFQPSGPKTFIEQQAQRETAAHIDVISSEILSGNPFYGGHESATLAHRVYNIAPYALILITIREQISIMTSVYMQYLERSGTMSPHDFFAESPVMGYRTFAPEHFQYHRLVGLYRDLFGSSRVMVLTQESLALEPTSLAATVADFSGNPTAISKDGLMTGRVAASYPEFVSPLLRRINHFRAGPVKPAPFLDLGSLSRLTYRSVGAAARTRPLQAWLGRSHPVRDLVRSRFSGRFSQSNRLLKSIIGDHLDLSSYET